MKKPTKGINTDLISGIFCLLMSALFLYASFTYPKLDRSDLIVSARFFPKIVSIGMTICSIIIILRAFIKPKRRGSYTAEEKLEYLRVLIVVALCIAYVFIMPKLGFILTSIILMAAVQLAFENRNILTVLLVSILFPLVLYAAFRFGLNVMLPKGLFGF